jgi:hypothetical protein
MSKLQQVIIDRLEDGEDMETLIEKGLLNENRRY